MTIFPAGGGGERGGINTPGTRQRLMRPPRPVPARARRVPPSPTRTPRVPTHHPGALAPSGDTRMCQVSQGRLQIGGISGASSQPPAASGRRAAYLPPASRQLVRRPYTGWKARARLQASPGQTLPALPMPLPLPRRPLQGPRLGPRHGQSREVREQEQERGPAPPRAPGPMRMRARVRVR